MGDLLVPQGFDVSGLGARQVAGWVAVFGLDREQYGDGRRYRETVERSAFDADLAERGTTRPLMWNHGHGAELIEESALLLGRAGQLEREAAPFLESVLV